MITASGYFVRCHCGESCTPALKYDDPDLVLVRCPASGCHELALGRVERLPAGALRLILKNPDDPTAEASAGLGGKLAWPCFQPAIHVRTAFGNCRSDECHPTRSRMA